MFFVFRGREIRVTYQRTDPQPAFRGRLDLVQLEIIDIDQMCRRFDVQLHQIEQVGAARDELRSGLFSRRGRSLCRSTRTFVGEGPHALLRATSLMASTMFE